MHLIVVSLKVAYERASPHRFRVETERLSGPNQACFSKKGLALEAHFFGITKTDRS